MKKRDRKQAPRVLTQDQINAVGAVLVRKIAVLLQEFIKETGQVVGVVDVATDAAPKQNGVGYDLQQTVSIKFGAVQPIQQQETSSLQIGKVGP